MDTRLKASFGTALKLIDPRHPGATAAMAVATVIAFLMSPPLKTFVDGVTSRSLWSALQQRLLPHDNWFGVDWRQLARRSSPPATAKGANAIQTGSIAPAPAVETPAK
jgi:hypothetical protein